MAQGPHRFFYRIPPTKPIFHKSFGVKPTWITVRNLQNSADNRTNPHRAHPLTTRHIASTSSSARSAYMGRHSTRSAAHLATGVSLLE